MPALSRIVSLFPVTDVDRSIAFYQQLGFTVGQRIEMDEGKAGWAWIDNGRCAFMLAHAEQPPVQNKQQMFYLYGADVLAMWKELTAAGVACSPIESPFYAPNGEFRVEDPDGYVLMFTHD
jgi:catechol 2,3-dioxygenase-like lactoylglutathione lyase family enzyme